MLSYKQTNKQITYLAGNSTTEDVHNAIVIEKIPKIPNEANGIIKEEISVNEDPENEGSLLRGIDNCLFWGSIYGTSWLEGPGQFFFISTQKHNRCYQKSCPR